jgi:hypothetical protein
MRRTLLRRNRRAGVLLDAVLGLGAVLLGAFALDTLGISWTEILHGASRFFGVG